MLNPPDNPDYWVKVEKFVDEFRVHSFLGKSLRAGPKRVIPGRVDPHPWIKSEDGGWAITYTGVTPDVRELAHKAVNALNLDFGAVDIGKREDGSLVVLEVNRAPGLDEGGCAAAYAAAIEVL